MEYRKGGLRGGRGGLRAGLLLMGMLAASGQAATLTRTSAFAYGSDGILNKEVIEPSNSNLCVVTQYTHDVYGNRTGSTVRNCNGGALASGNEAPAPIGAAAFAARTSSVGYDSQGRFPTTSTNALLQTETRTYDSKTAAVASLTDPNGLTTRWEYDGFGRKTLEIRADGNKIQWDYLYCNGVGGGTSNCPVNAATLVRTTPLNSSGVVNGAVTETYYDVLGRTPGSKSDDDRLLLVGQLATYDAFDRVISRSGPGAFLTVGTTLSVGGPRVQFTYDDLNRVQTETHFSDTGVAETTTYAYNGLQMLATNAQGKTQTTIKNSQGQVVSIKDANSKLLTYKYDPFGNLIETIDPLNNSTKLVYDLRGRKIQMQDPDMGLWRYEYNALGELVKQTDAKNQGTTQAYDKLGRMTSRTEPGLISTWTYDSCTKGVGKLCSVQTDNGTQRVTTYDALGRPSSVVTTLDAAYTSSVTYEANGRVATRTYPTGFAVKYTYAARGFLTEVRNQATNVLYWKASADDVNTKGQLTKATYGNNVIANWNYGAETGNLLTVKAGTGTATAVQNLTYTYDSLSNLLSRQDTNQGLVETFAYDTLNRLKTVNTQGGGVTGIVQTSVTYDDLGNITSKTGVGTYSYNPSGAASVRPHAVASIVGAKAATYTYDANGNLLTGMGRTVSYTGFNMPATIAGSGSTLNFVYNDTHQRVKQIAPSGTVYYVHPDNAGGLFYEKEIKTGGVVEHRHYITAGGSAVAIYTTRSTNVNTLRYLHKDNLGSINVVTDESGTVVERLAYDAWGKRQYPNGTLDTAGTLAGTQTDRGYTGHEHLEEVGLVHMNGRVYDPTVGRFMSADPFIQAPSSLQSFNRYAYGFNNPLNGVDPSGYGFISGLIGDLWDAGTSVIKALVIPTPKNIFNAVSLQPFQSTIDKIILKNPILNSVGQAASAFFTPFCGGCGAAAWSSYYTYQATGSTGTALKVGAISYATTLAANGISARADGPLQNYLGQAAIGCASGAASGGNCGKGAMSSVVGKWASNNSGGLGQLQFTTAVVAGGTVSVINGGKFANGAVTGSFNYAFKNIASGMNAGETALDTLGRLWASPNSVIGGAIGLAGLPFGAMITLGNNAIQFEKYPLGNSALTLGNVIIYAGDTAPETSGTGMYEDPRNLNIGLHEMGHTYQYQMFGPLFLPIYLLNGGIGSKNPFERAANNYAGGGGWKPW